MAKREKLFDVFKMSKDLSRAQMIKRLIPESMAKAMVENARRFGEVLIDVPSCQYNQYMSGCFGPKTDHKIRVRSASR